MFERYTDGARRAIFLARTEAGDDRSPSIESEHLLQGVIAADKERLANLITRASRDAIQEKVLRAKKVYGGGSSSSDDRPLSNECKRAMAVAAEEADNLKSATIEVEHLLLGLLREPKSTAGRILKEQGLELGALRQKLGGSAEMPAATSSGMLGKFKKMFGGGDAS
jgi:ATP-dependent Clp protease ATP-binding subunit ClpC